MYTCMEYTLYDTIYSDERTLQMHVQTPPPPQKKKKKNQKKNKQTNKQKQKPLKSPPAKLHLTSAEMCSSKPLKFHLAEKYYTMYPVAWTVKIYGTRCLRSELSMINK